MKLVSKARRAAAFMGISLVLACQGVAAEPAETAVSPEYAGEIGRLLDRPGVRKAFADLEAANARNIADLITLTEIPAPPFKEDQRAKAFADMLRAAGLKDVTIDDEGNVLGMRKGTVGKKTTALVAHLDTVFPEGTDVTVRVDGERYTAPGIGDNTRGLVALLSVLRVLEANRIETADNILFVGSVGEEGLGDLRGVKYLLRDGGPRIDSFIAIDGGDDSRLVYSAVGSIRYRVTFRGPGGHSWGSYGLPHPHHALARAITAFAGQASEITAEGDKASFSVGRIGGGTSINSIPFESWMEVDMRSGNKAKLAALEKTFLGSVEQALKQENSQRRRGDELTVEVDRIGVRPAGKGDTSSALVQRAMAAMGALGIAPVLEQSSTDANVAIAKDIQAITLSRGGKSGGAHSPEEWWENRDSHKALQVLLLTTLAQSGY